MGKVFYIFDVSQNGSVSESLTHTSGHRLVKSAPRVSLRVGLIGLPKPDWPDTRVVTKLRALFEIGFIFMISLKTFSGKICGCGLGG